MPRPQEITKGIYIISRKIQSLITYDNEPPGDPSEKSMTDTPEMSWISFIGRVEKIQKFVKMRNILTVKREGTIVRLRQYRERSVGDK